MMHSVVQVEPVWASPAARPDLVSVEEIRSRAQWLRLLAGAFAEEPSLQYLRALRQPEALASLAEVGLHFDADFQHTPIDRLQDILACEFTTLLASPGGCAPVESARLAGRYQQQPYYEVRQAYQEAGFQVQRGRFEVFDDALGVELQFVAALLERVGDALERDDMAAQVRAEKALKRFWVQHLGRWARGFATLVERATEHSFYREMARLLRMVTENELERLRLQVEDADGARAVVPKAEVPLLFDPDEPVCGACAAEPSPAC